jgi:hypothetical protein
MWLTVPGFDEALAETSHLLSRCVVREQVGPLFHVFEKHVHRVRAGEHVAVRFQQLAPVFY